MAGYSRAAKFLIAALILTSAGLMAFAAWSYIHLDNAERRQDRMAAELADTQAKLDRTAARLEDINTVNKRLDDFIAQGGIREKETKRLVADTLLKLVALESKDAQNLRQVDELRTRVDETRKSATHSQETADLALEGASFMLEAAQKPPSEARRMVAFSSIVAAAPIKGGVIDGSGGVDTASFDYTGAISIDGVHVVSVEKYELKNGKANAITILAPGLQNLENNQLEIDGDPKLDSVTLDGCLTWSKKSLTKDRKVLWAAADTEGKTREVLVTAGIPVSTDSICDNRYDFAIRKREFPEMWIRKAAAVDTRTDSRDAPPNRRRKW
ncbi:MAG: hypothetical protein EPN97_00675 [Alphaproteobacteria bacterium]|nr:MAG: hypothetical protein EPN97_00675 [Alphaproteobacteria bacterium]